MVQAGKTTGMGKGRLGVGLGHIHSPGQQMSTGMIQADLRQAVARRAHCAFLKRKLQRFRLPTLDHRSQNKAVAARATAERTVFAHLS